jgi:hypothetical protein
MKGNEIAKITLEINPEQLEKITDSGRLEEFVVKATEIFKRDLKAELVQEAVSSVETALMMVDNDFGVGPRPLPWHNIARIERLATRVEKLEEQAATKTM